MYNAQIKKKNRKCFFKILHFFNHSHKPIVLIHATITPFLKKQPNVLERTHKICKKYGAGGFYL